ncbi:TonB-dependent receptor [Cytophagaceae bacterium YF14B1]|uniref:TonB-dependent receptor n=1 Tax=Xanthocytophaga flava TaxID=3048013 RepID=A0AAE3QXI1_9BACT|nr:TonB-dependent receptor [Xanthocytophaga flavus]MDJ1485375.1 TonB-dependent receptor [Xanthocytophaga flavus]
MNSRLSFILFIFPVILFLVTVQSGIAQQQAADSIRSYQLKETVVTATRSSIEKERIPQQIDIISQKDIKQTSFIDAIDLVKKNSSVSVLQYPGLLGGVSIRGFRPQFSGINQRTLLLVDGRPAGTVNLATIDPGSIERIEVLKGPASALYGAQAMGGVVNVITRKSTDKIHSSLLAEYGSYSSLRIGGQTGGNLTEKLDFDLSFQSFSRNDDYKTGKDNWLRNALRGGTAIKYYIKQPATEINDSRGDGIRRDYTQLSYYSGSLRAGYQLTSSWRLDVRGERFLARGIESPSDIEYGNTQPSTKDIGRANGEVSLAGTMGIHQLSLKGYTAQETSDNYTLENNGVKIPPYRSYQSQSSWKGIQVKDVLKIGIHQLTLGIDYTSVSIQTHSYSNDTTETRPYSPNYALRSTAIYAQGQFFFLNNRLTVTPGLRFDRITFDVKATPLLTTYTPGKETNPFLSPSLGAQYQIIEPLKVHATIGRAFVTPDAYQVAGFSQLGSNKSIAITEGNTDLTNENSITWDAGIRFIKPAIGFTADITYFSTVVQDRITSRTIRYTTPEFTANGDTVKSRTTYVNANKGEIRGLEAEVAYDFGALKEYAYSLRVFANTTSISYAKEITIATDGTTTRKDIYNVASLTMNYGIEYNNLKGASLRINGRYVGHRKDTDYNDLLYPEIQYPVFMVIDMAASYTYAHQHTVSLLVNNLTDENYYEKRGYNMPGRNFTLRYSFTF